MALKRIGTGLLLIAAMVAGACGQSAPPIAPPATPAATPTPVSTATPTPVSAWIPATAGPTPVQVMGWEVDRQLLGLGPVVVSRESDTGDFAKLFLTCEPPLDVEVLWGTPWRGEEYLYDRKFDRNHRLKFGPDLAFEDVAMWGDMYPYVSNGEQLLATRFYDPEGLLGKLQRWPIVVAEVSILDGSTVASATFMTEGLDDALNRARWDC